MEAKFALLLFVLFGAIIVQARRNRDGEIDRSNRRFMNDFRPFAFGGPAFEFPEIKMPEMPKIEIPEIKVPDINVPDVEKMKCKPGSRCQGMTFVAYASEVNGVREQGGEWVLNDNGKVTKQKLGN